MQANTGLESKASTLEAQLTTLQEQHEVTEGRLAEAMKRVRPTPCSVALNVASLLFTGFPVLPMAPTADNCS